MLSRGPLNKVNSNVPFADWNDFEFVSRRKHLPRRVSSTHVPSVLTQTLFLLLWQIKGRTVSARAEGSRERPR